MKKHVFIPVSALMAIIIVFSAFILPLNEGQKEFPTEKFSKVSIALKSTVYVEQGENYKLDIKADEKILEKISVKFKSDELEIECKSGCRIDEPVTIYITAPSLNGIYIAGSADLFVEKTFETNEMELSVAGSGKMSLNDLRSSKLSASVAGSGKMIINELKSEKVEASVAGSGDILVKSGKSGLNEDFSIAGSGNIDASGFESREVKVEIAGSGDCKVNASEMLIVSIAGSGSVYYNGKPQIKKEIAGSGKIKQIGVEIE